MRYCGKISILGDGGWGTTLAILLSKKGHRITLWGAFGNYVEYLKKYRENKKFLPGIRIPPRIRISSRLQEAIEGSGLIILAIPSQFLRNILKKIKKIKYKDKIFLSVTKGIERKSLLTMSEVIKQELGNVKVAVLSGPTIAYEVARGVPTACVVASGDLNIARKMQEIFMTRRLRVYTSRDVIGTELGGSIKNIIAIACGISDGLGFGTNTKAALLARGLVEITRLGVALGAKEKTFSGISGLGDLVTTCISLHSRNRFVGEQIGRGKKMKEIIRKMEMIAEGVATTKSVYDLSRKIKIEMPITNEVFNVLYKNKSPLHAVDDLMTRERKHE